MPKFKAPKIGPDNICDYVERPILLIPLLTSLLTWNGAMATVPPGCKPPELVISPEHPLVILYGPGSGELTVKCWQHLPADIRPYCAVTMDPASLNLKERLDIWRRM